MGEKRLLNFETFEFFFFLDNLIVDSEINMQSFFLQVKCYRIFIFACFCCGLGFIC